MNIEDNEVKEVQDHPYLNSFKPVLTKFSVQNILENLQSIDMDSKILGSQQIFVLLNHLTETDDFFLLSYVLKQLIIEFDEPKLLKENMLYKKAYIGISKAIQICNDNNIHFCLLQVSEKLFKSVSDDSKEMIEETFIVKALA